MKLRAIHLFLILLLSLLLCCCLGNTYEYMSSEQSKTHSYTGPAGDTVTVSGGNIESMSNQQPKTGSYTGPAGDTVYTYSTNTNSSGGSATKVTGPQGNSAVIVNEGIPASQIPDGDEDLYILKSQVVPPVCPACPSNASCPRPEPPPPCPPCARCPEPSFECKKVPNYKSGDDSYLPRPVLSDFSSFGM